MIARPASLLRLGLFFLAMQITGILLVTGLEWIFEPVRGQSNLGFVLPMLAGLSTGYYWYGREQVPPATARIWWVSAVCAVLALAIPVVFVAALYATGHTAGLPVWGQLSPGQRQGLGLALPLVALAVFGMTRLGFGLGLRTARKQAAKLAAKRTPL